MRSEDYIRTNRKLWDSWAARHVDSAFYDVERFKRTRDSLHAIERDLLPDLSGKRVLHLQCHFGQDSLSLAHLGARVFGLDLSPVAIAAAKKLAREIELEAEFRVSDVLEPVTEWLASMDVVFASYGVIGWVPKAEDWMDAAFSYLVPGGELIFVEFHPYLWILDDDTADFAHSYFNGGAIRTQEKGSYAAPSSAAQLESVTWNHALSQVLSPILDHPERSLVCFSEYDYSPYDIFPSTEIGPGRYQVKGKEGMFPLVYALKARKSA